MANYTIINDDELADYIASLLIIRYYRKGPHWHFCNKIYAQHYNGVKPIHGEAKDLERIQKAVLADCTNWQEQVYKDKTSQWKHKRRKIVKLVYANFDRVCSYYGSGDEKRGHRLLVNQYLNSTFNGYMKQLSNGIFKSSFFRTPSTYSTVDSDCLIRNILNNEQLINNKIKNNFPFWFVDSGYTNFTRDSETKEWHRLVRNDIHMALPKYTFPMDRLMKLLFDNRHRLNGFKFPTQWRTDGDTILIIPPSEYVCQVHNLNQSEWIANTVKTLEEHTNKKIVVRQKEGTRKTRISLYRDLLTNESVYCVVGYNSNALTEAVWAGVPIITLGKHITNLVSRNSLDKINDLYRGDVSQWLCYLSYSQFTSKELQDGTAKQILEIWHV